MRSSAQRSISEGAITMKALCTILFAGFAAALTGCSTAPTRVALPPAGAAANRLVPGNQTRSHGWMLPDAKGMDLLYVSNDDQLLVFSYPKGKLVGEISVASGDFFGLCSDSAGNVFVTSVGSRSQSYILEYAHGGTEPIATLSDPGWADGCAVDPTTGNVAVTNYFADYPPYYHGDVVVFPKGQGPPSEYSDPNVGNFLFCSYDATGDLFADGGSIAELPVGGQSLSDITLDKHVDASSIQWIDASQTFVVADRSGGPRGPIDIYQVQVSGSAGTVSGPIILRTKHNRSSRAAQFWTGDGRMVGPGLIRGEVAGLLVFWRYPKGGRPTRIIDRPDGALDLYGITVSRANAKSTRVRGVVSRSGSLEGQR
jgi:hypothetical protein